MPLSYKLIKGHIKIATADWMTNDNNLKINKKSSADDYG